MREFQKTFRIELTTMSPVFIGDGRSLGKKDYIRKGDILYVPDMHRMYEGLKKRNLLSAYEEFILDNQRGDLGSWLNSRKVSWGEINSWTRYTLKTGDLTSRLTQLNTFIKDPYNNPYIPGSSLKGAFRTILLAYILGREKDDFEGKRTEIREEAFSSRDGRNYYLKNTTRELEVQAFNRLDRLNKRGKDIENAVNDFMSGMRISDSRPLSTETLVMCEKMDMLPSGAFKTPNVARECLRPHTKVEFDLTLDEAFPFSVDEIMDAVRCFCTRYLNCFYKYFYKQNHDLLPPRINYIWLGGGVGYVSKTVIYNLLDRDDRVRTAAEIMQRTVKDPRHGHQKDVDMGVSPHMLKCTKCEGKFYEFGQCALKICQ